MGKKVLEKVIFGKGIKIVRTKIEEGPTGIFLEDANKFHLCVSVEDSVSMRQKGYESGISLNQKQSLDLLRSFKEDYFGSLSGKNVIAYYYNRELIAIQKDDSK